MRKMLCEIALQKAQGYPGRYLEHFFARQDRATAYAECRESAAKLGLRYIKNGHSAVAPANLHMVIHPKGALEAETAVSGMN